MILVREESDDKYEFAKRVKETREKLFLENPPPEEIVERALSRAILNKTTLDQEIAKCRALTSEEKRVLEARKKNLPNAYTFRTLN